MSRRQNLKFRSFRHDQDVAEEKGDDRQAAHPHTPCLDPIKFYAQRHSQEERPEEKGGKGFKGEGLKGEEPLLTLPQLDFHFLEFKGLDGFDPQSCKWKKRPASALELPDSNSTSRPHFTLPRIHAFSQPITAQGTRNDDLGFEHAQNPHSSNFEVFLTGAEIQNADSADCACYHYNCNGSNDFENLRLPSICKPKKPKKGGKSKKLNSRLIKDVKNNKETCEKQKGAKDNMTMDAETEFKFKLDRFKVFGGDQCSYLRHKIRQKYRKPGADNYLPPPVDCQDLKITCGRVIDPTNLGDGDSCREYNYNVKECLYKTDDLGQNGVKRFSTKIPNNNNSRKGREPNKSWNYGNSFKDQNYEDLNSTLIVSWSGREVKIGRNNNSLKKCGAGGFAAGINQHRSLVQSIPLPPLILRGKCKEYFPSKSATYFQGGRGKCKDSNSNLFNNNVKSKIDCWWGCKK